MSEAKVIFNLDEADLTIDCSSDDKMKDISQKFATKVGKDIDLFLFLYGENKVNFDLSFKEQANSLDRINNQMKIIVYQKNNQSYENLTNKNLFDNIKSAYLLQFIFSYMKEKVKLESIKYNKKLQNKNEISLINYKLFSGGYIIYETKTQGKIYSGKTNNLLFEGEYLNGKRNGKGKEYYDNGKLNYEGEYSNGKRNGKGKEYSDDGKLKFEGEYKNGYRWSGQGFGQFDNIVYELEEGKGDIKEYLNDDIVFKGEYLNGTKNGKGKEYDRDLNLIFEGEYLNGIKWNGKIYDNNKNAYELKEGKGYIKEYYYDILIFEGQYLNGQRNGKGKEYDEGDLIFEGEYLNGQRNGKGKEYDCHGCHGKLIFEGDYLYDYKLRGKQYLKEKLEYEGEYLFNKKWNGKGYDENGNIIYELINGNGKVKEYYWYSGQLEYDGEYLNGIKNGKGKEYKYDKLLFEGEYLNDKRNGKGKEYNNKDVLIFEGEYLNGIKNGKGKEYNNKGELIFEGEYLNGKRWNGKGKEYDWAEALIFEGEYKNGEKWNGKVKVYHYKEGCCVGFLINEEVYKNGEKIPEKYSQKDSQKNSQKKKCLIF